MPSTESRPLTVPSTPASEIAALHLAQKTYFQTNATKSYDFRLQQLFSLLNLVEDNYHKISKALNSDLGKTPFEAQVTELETTMSTVREAIHALPDWMHTTQVPSPAAIMPSFSSIRKEARGVVLIIGPFNYPIATVLGPLVSVIAGGNTAVIKPSEMCPATSALLKKLINKYFAPEYITVVEGEIPETVELMKLDWDLVHFTGSTRVGKIIQTYAAQTLSPCILELGGKSPCVITANPPHMKTMCDRIFWGKCINAGQTCVAVDYMLVHESQVESVIEGLTNALKEMYKGDVKNGGVYSRVVNSEHTKRLKDWCAEAEKGKGCKLIFGGADEADIDERYFPPTVLLNPPKGCKILTEEIFGSILPIIPYSTNEEAAAYINNMPGTPLAFYCFTSTSQEYHYFLDNVRSGNSIRNDTLLQFAISTLPFGGLGSSGYGSGHGIHGFNSFTHSRAILDKPCHPLFEFGGIRYPPYDKFFGISGKLFKTLMGTLPDVPVFYIKTMLNSNFVAMVGGILTVCLIAAIFVLSGRADIMKNHVAVLRNMMHFFGEIIVRLGEWFNSW